MESRISFVDGVKGRLLYYGYDIRDLADHSTFEETAYLLWHGKLPNRDRLAAFSAELAANRPIPKGIVSLPKGLPRETAPIDALRTAASALAGYDPEPTDSYRARNAQQAMR